MKKQIVVSYVALLAFMAPLAHAKRSMKTVSKQQKAELKKWAKQKATMSPYQLKQLIEDNLSLRMQYEHFVQESKVVQEALEAELAMLRMQLAVQERESRRQPDTAREGAAVSGELDVHDLASAAEVAEDDQRHLQEVIFKVQIGAYNRGGDLSGVLKDEGLGVALEQEQVGSLVAYTLGRFKNYWRANQFKKVLRNMGLKDAWVVVFKHGERVPFSEVLSEVVAWERE